MSVIQVWFMRHGKTPFNYENSCYDDFINMLCNGHKTPLLKDDHDINFNKLPGQVDLVIYSPAQRAIDTANVLSDKLQVKQKEESQLLREVQFDRDILHEDEFKSLPENRKDILERWYDGTNQSETVEESLARVKEIESLLNERQEKKIIIVTHGWFLRLLEIYFKQGKHEDITLEDILKVEPVPLGQCFKAKIVRRKIPNLVREEIPGPTIVAQPGTFIIEPAAERAAHYLAPIA